MKIFTSLQSKETRAAIEKEYRDILSYGHIVGENIDPALELHASLAEKLKTEKVSDPELLNRYKTILISLRVRSFSYFPEQKAFNFFKAHFVTACIYDLVGEVSLFGMMRHFFSYWDLAFREPVIQKIARIVRENTEHIGKRALVINGTEAAPQFNNWLRDYVDTIGGGRHSLDGIRQYFVQSKNAKALSRPERAVLMRALKYHELLKLKTQEIGSPANKPLLGWGFSFAEASVVNEDPFDVSSPDPLFMQYETYDAFIVVLKSGVEPKKTKLPSAQPVRRVQVPSPSPRSQLPAPLPKRIISTDSVLKKTVAPQPQKPLVPPVIKKEEPIGAPEREELLSTPESIERLSILDFRSLGKADNERLDAVREKIDRIRKSSPDLLLHWQKSPLYQLYLSIGRASMTSEKSVSDIGRQLFKEGKPYLTQREFEMVAELSSEF